ncbi:hypothetical protein PR048_018389 [Dryococelus australis]|uniref:DDE-1 domain-containing protein n=1 Tax=Dryococelus australis TaxID=614101 RepID=A0ABQ9HCV5_9NEOP|nr:hypothetical protein PR048_018389 [Dryococelus australis]
MKEQPRTTNATMYAFRGLKAGKFPELGAQVLNFICELRNNAYTVSHEMVQVKAWEIVCSMNIPHMQFKANPDGGKLPPCIILKRKPMPKGISFPFGVHIRVHEKDWMDDVLVKDCPKAVWDRRPGALLKKRALLIWDSFRTHLVEDVKHDLYEAKTDIAVIPAMVVKSFKKTGITIALDGTEDYAVWEDNDAGSSDAEEGEYTAQSDVVEYNSFIKCYCYNFFFMSVIGHMDSSRPALSATSLWVGVGRTQWLQEWHAHRTQAVFPGESQQYY